MVRQLETGAQLSQVTQGGLAPSTQQMGSLSLLGSWVEKLLGIMIEIGTRYPAWVASGKIVKGTV